MFERKEDLEELRKAQCGIVDVIVTKQVTFRTKALVCFDLDKRETFVMTLEEYTEDMEQYKRAWDICKAEDCIVKPCFCVETATGRHYNWVWNPDGNYSEHEVSK